MDGHERTGGDARPEVVDGRSRFVGDQGGERVGVAADDLPLAGKQGRARADDFGRRRNALAEVAARALARTLEDEATEGLEHRLAGRPVADRGEQLFLEVLEAAVDEVFFGREVVEDGRRRDVGGLRDLGHRDGVEAAFGEQRQRRGGDRLARLLLLPLSQSWVGHRRQRRAPLGLEQD